MRILLISIYDEWCLGLRSIAAVLKQKGHKVSLIHFHCYSEIYHEIGIENPSFYHTPVIAG